MRALTFSRKRHVIWHPRANTRSSPFYNIFILQSHYLILIYFAADILISRINGLLINLWDFWTNENLWDLKFRSCSGARIFRLRIGAGTCDSCDRSYGWKIKFILLEVLVDILNCWFHNAVLSYSIIWHNWVKCIAVEETRSGQGSRSYDASRFRKSISRMHAQLLICIETSDGFSWHSRKFDNPSVSMGIELFSNDKCVKLYKLLQMDPDLLLAWKKNFNA